MAAHQTACANGLQRAPLPIRPACTSATRASVHCGSRNDTQHVPKYSVRKSRHRLLAVASSSQTQSQAQPSADERERLASMGGVVTDAAVPEGHKGLHGFLYGEGGAEEHDSRGYQLRQGEDDGTTLLPVEDYLATRDAEKPIGIYAAFNAKQELQYVSYSRNMVLSIKGHLDQIGEQRCAFVRTKVFANKAMATRANLEKEASAWIAAAEQLPPGNGPERDLWGGAVAVQATMSDAERAEYEEKKLKMRKAMGENLGDAVEGETPDAKQRRLDLIKAVEGDNWSAVIDKQTAETVSKQPSQPGAAAGAASPAAQPQEHTHPTESPFSHVEVHRSIGNDEPNAAVQMTVETVDRALQEVRPYLLADGGDVTVVGVHDGVVMLQLEGACGTCASSSATMKMGIERALKSAFGPALREVQQVGAKDTSASLASVNEHLEMLRPAIANYGGFVEVLSVERGVCTVRYEGPAPISMGVKAAIKDKFPDIKDVVFADA